MKQPFPLQDIELRKYLLDYAILINRAEKAGWDPFSDVGFEDSLEDLLLRRYNRIFHERFEQERINMFRYLEEMVIELNREYINPEDLRSMIIRKSEDEKKNLHVKLNFGAYHKSNINRIEYRIKSRDSFWKKFIRSLRPNDEDKKKELGYDFGAFLIEWMSQRAKESIQAAEWNKFTEQTRKYVIGEAGKYVKLILTDLGKIKRSEKNDEQKNIEKLCKKFKNDIINKKGLTHDKRAENIYDFLIKHRVDLDSPQYKEVMKNIRLIRDYSNLTDSNKKLFEKKYEDYANKKEVSNESILREHIRKRINDKSLVTMPYGPIVMAMLMPGAQDIEKEVTICSQVVLSRDENKQREIIDVDYLLFNTDEGKEEFLNTFDNTIISPMNMEGIIFGKRKHALTIHEDVVRNFAIFEQGNLVVYISSVLSSKKIMDFIYGHKSEPGAFSVISNNYKNNIQKIKELEKIINENISQRKKNKKKIVFNWENDVYKPQHEFLKDIKLTNNDIDPGYVMFPDTWRADIVAKIDWLNAVTNQMKNLTALSKDYFNNPKKRYKSIQDRICIDKELSESGNRELSIEEINHTPKSYHNHTRGLAKHEKFKVRQLIEWKKGINSSFFDYGEIFFGDEEELFNNFLLNFHLNKIKNYTKKLANSFNSLKPEQASEYIKRALNSYDFLIKENLVKENVAGDYFRNIIKHYSELQPIESFFDIAFGNNQSKINDLGILLNKEISSYNKDKKNKLELLDFDDLKKQIIDVYCCNIISTAEYLSEHVKKQVVYKSAAGYQVYAHFVLKSLNKILQQNVTDEYYEESLFETNNKLEEIQILTDDFIKENWKLTSKNVQQKGIKYVPDQIKPHKISSYVNEENIKKEMGNTKRAIKEIILNFYAHFQPTRS